MNHNLTERQNAVIDFFSWALTKTRKDSISLIEAGELIYHWEAEQKLNIHGVMQAEGSAGAEEAAVASEGQGEANTCADCRPTEGFYLGESCPTCRKPFRIIERA